jgi:hypothetical protein
VSLALQNKAATSLGVIVANWAALVFPYVNALHALLAKLEAYTGTACAAFGQENRSRVFENLCDHGPSLAIERSSTFE